VTGQDIGEILLGIRDQLLAEGILDQATVYISWEDISLFNRWSWCNEAISLHTKAHAPGNLLRMEYSDLTEIVPWTVVIP
jgi:hypothetical protein